MKKIIVSLMVVLLCISAANAGVLIGGSVQNGDFEDPATGKVIVDTGLIPSWSVWSEGGTSFNDTGVDTISGGTPGVDTRILFIQPGGAAKNMTTETIDVGEDYTYSLDYASAERGAGGISLVYDDGGVITAIAGTLLNTGTDVNVTNVGTFTAVAGEAYIGKAIGIGLTPVGSWPEVDNATLTLVRDEKAKNPTPTGAELEPVTTTELTWDAPAAYDPNGYDLVFRAATEATEPNFLALDNIIEITGMLATSPQTVTLAYETTYYWRVDAYEPNLVSPNVPIRHEGEVWSFTTIPETPEIIADPVSQTVVAGTEVTLSVTAERATEYRWFKDGAEIAASDANTLVLSNVQMVDETDYHCEAYNAAAPYPNAYVDAVSAEARVMTERLVGWWKLDDNLFDSVNDDPDVTGAPTHDGSAIEPNFVPIAKDSYGYEFDGEPNAIVLIGGDANDFNFYPQGYTVSAWVKTTQTTLWGAFVAKQGANPDRGFILTHDGTGQAVHTLRQSFGNLYSGVQIDDGTGEEDENWHLVVGTYDGAGNGKVYVDGLVADEATSAGVPEISTNPLIFGAEWPDGSVPYVGRLDDVRIWSYPRTPQQIADLYTGFNSGVWLCLNRPELDTTGPEGVPDCVVDLYELVLVVETWLDCGISPASLCN